jgi:hypothetical protein
MSRRLEADVAVPRFGVAVGVVAVGQHADGGEGSRLFAERPHEIGVRVPRKRLPPIDAGGPLDATIIWMRRVCGFAISVPTRSSFDQMYISVA